MNIKSNKRTSVMNIRTRNYLLTFAAMLIVAVIAVCTLMSLGSHDAAWNMTVNGEAIDGIAGAGFAFGGVVIGLASAVFALVLCGVILAGVALFLMGVFAFLLLI